MLLLFAAAEETELLARATSFPWSAALDPLESQ